MKVFINFSYEYVGKEKCNVAPFDTNFDIIIADNKSDAVKYNLFSYAIKMSHSNKENNKNLKRENDYIYGDIGYGDYFNIFGVMSLKLQRNYIEIILADDEYLQNIADYRFRGQFTQEDIKYVFEQFCLNNFGEEEHYVWTYDEFNKNINDLSITLYTDNIMISEDANDFHMIYESCWLSTIAEYNLKDGHLKDLFFDVIKYDKENTSNCKYYKHIDEMYFQEYYKSYTEDEIKTLGINTNDYVKKAFNIESCSQSFIEIIRKPEFIIEDDAALVIQKTWKDALVDPNCKVGLVRINRDYDNMIKDNL